MCGMGRRSEGLVNLSATCINCKQVWSSCFNYCPDCGWGLIKKYQNKKKNPESLEIAPEPSVTPKERGQLKV